MTPEKPVETKLEPSDLQLVLAPIVLKHGLLDVVEELSRIEARIADELWDTGSPDGAAEALSCAWELAALADKLPGAKTTVMKAGRALRRAAK